jgi:hypothetical protein
MSFLCVLYNLSENHTHILQDTKVPDTLQGPSHLVFDDIIE